MGQPIKLSPQQSAETTAQSGHNNLREFSVLRKSTELIDGRLQTAEASITVQAGEIASKVSQTDYNGNTIASLINQTATTIDIEASKINLNGAVTANNYFKINLDGSMEATNGLFTGTITSTEGTIGGWSITSTSLQTGAYNTAGTRYFGSSGISIGTTFRVTSAGALTATSGTIGGWTLNGSTDIHKGVIKLDAVNERIYLNTSAYMQAGSTGTLITLSGGLNATGSVTTGAAVGNTLLAGFNAEFKFSNRVLSDPTDLFNYANTYVTQNGLTYRLKISGTSVVAEDVSAYF